MQWWVNELSLKNIGKNREIKTVVSMYLADIENTYLKINLSKDWIKRYLNLDM